MLHEYYVYEIDGGPDGRWFEVYLGSVYMGIAKMHTLADWEAENV